MLRAYGRGIPARDYNETAISLAASVWFRVRYALASPVSIQDKLIETGRYRRVHHLASALSAQVTLTVSQSFTPLARSLRLLAPHCSRYDALSFYRGLCGAVTRRLPRRWAFPTLSLARPIQNEPIFYSEKTGTLRPPRGPAPRAGSINPL